MVLHFSQAVIFWINVPIGIISMLMLARRFPETGEKHQHRLNITGSVLLMIAVTALFGALLQAGLSGTWGLILLAVAVICGRQLYRQQLQVEECLK